MTEVIRICHKATYFGAKTSYMGSINMSAIDHGATAAKPDARQMPPVAPSVPAPAIIEVRDTEQRPFLRTPEEAAALIWQQWNACHRLAADRRYDQSHLRF